MEHIKIQDFYPLYKSATSVTIDSRNITGGEIFFAFSGSFNAATQAENAINIGAKAVIVEDKNYHNPEKNIFFVPSTLLFLQELAHYHRNQLSIPIIALTGSNGKTTTKELIHAVLSQKYNVQYTHGNLNNHIGVPLTLLSIKEEHQLAIIEMGANHQKEIQTLCAITQPNIGYITNFGKAHLEGFGGFEGVIKGKSEMYDYLKSKNCTILINSDDEIQIEKTKNYHSIISFGTQVGNYIFTPVERDHKIGIRYQAHEIISRLTGSYNFPNLSAAIALGLHFGIEISAIKQGIESYQPQNMRSQMIARGNFFTIIDTYNANPSSMEVSLKNFNNFSGPKIAIMGDMLELGEESPIEHQRIFQLACDLAFEHIITVGAHFKNTNRLTNAFDITTELIEFLQKNPLPEGNVLLKGSRGIALEKILPFL